MIIIVVDDEMAALNLLKEEVQVAKPEAQVLAFASSVSALEYIKCNTVEIAFLDIEMPGISGIDLAHKIKGTQPNTNIIFVTAYREYGLEAMELHASGYLLKPVNQEGILRELNGLRYPIVPIHSGIVVTTFGRFEIQVNGVIVGFGRSKAKELLAYLIYSNGEYITRKEMGAVLFEDYSYSRKVQDYLSKIIKELKQSLEAVQIGQILCIKKNAYAIDTTSIYCDAYEYQKGTPDRLLSPIYIHIP